MFECLTHEVGLRGRRAARIDADVGVTRAQHQHECAHRISFRLFNLAGDAPTLVSINSGAKPVMWKAVAKDGYPLPTSQATSRAAVLVFDPGEIYDFEYTPTTRGELALKFGPPSVPAPPSGAPAPPPLPPGIPAPAPPPPTVTVQVHVR